MNVNRKLYLSWLRRAKVPDDVFRLLFELSYYANDDLECFPSQRLMAARLHWSPSKVGRVARKAVAAGVLVCRTGTGRASTQYRLIMDDSSPSQAPAKYYEGPRKVIMDVDFPLLEEWRKRKRLR